MTVAAWHRQEWEIQITPEPGEEWPRVPTMRGEIQPTKIIFYAQTTPGRRVTAIRGKLIRQDGKVGKRDGSTTTLPQWAAKLMTEAREARGWTRDHLVQQGAVEPVVIPRT